MNCTPGLETNALAVVFNGGKHHLALNNTVFHYADPSVRWFQGMTFVPSGGGAPVNIPRVAVTIRGSGNSRSTPRHCPTGQTLIYHITVVEIEGMGLSLATENLVTVACRNLDNTPVPMNTVAAVLTHEVGHKIGMVPGRRATRILTSNHPTMTVAGIQAGTVT